MPQRSDHTPSCSPDGHAPHAHVPVGARPVGEGDDPDRWVTSPCTGLCILDSADLCTGCGRTLDEVVRWTGMDVSQRRAVLAAAAARCSR